MSELRDQIARALWGTSGGDAHKVADLLMTVVQPEIDRQAADFDETFIKPERALHEQTIQRAEKAEAAIARVRALAEQWRYQQDRKRAAEELRAAIDRGGDQ